MNILQKAFFKNNLTAELKNIKKSSLMMNFNSTYVKNFSTFNNSNTFYSMNNKVSSEIYINKTIKSSNFYFTKKNNFAESK